LVRNSISEVTNLRRGIINIDLRLRYAENIRMGIFDVMGRKVVKIASGDF